VMKLDAHIKDFIESVVGFHSDLCFCFVFVYF
jgi:hypothetical protein